MGRMSMWMPGAFPRRALGDVALQQRDRGAVRRVRAAHGAVGRIDRDTPLLVLRGRCGDVDRARAFEHGADDFLAKPFSYPELRGRVAALLRRADRRLRVGRVHVGTLVGDPGSSSQSRLCPLRRQGVFPNAGAASQVIRTNRASTCGWPERVDVPLRGRKSKTIHELDVRPLSRGHPAGLRRRRVRDHARRPLAHVPDPDLSAMTAWPSSPTASTGRPTSGWG
jgi:hypothetical protein